MYLFGPDELDGMTERNMCRWTRVLEQLQTHSAKDARAFRQNMSPSDQPICAVCRWGTIKKGEGPKQIVEGGEFFVLKHIPEEGGHH